MVQLESKFKINILWYKIWGTLQNLIEIFLIVLYNSILGTLIEKMEIWKKKV